MMKSKKSILLVILTLCIALSVVFALTISASDGSKTEGFGFATNTYFDMEEAITPNGSMTFEAIMTIPGNDDTARHGWIAGNWESYELETNSIGFELQANRKIRIFLCKGLKVNTSVIFDLPENNDTTAYRRLTFTMNVNGDAAFYVDGVQSGETQNILSWMGDSPETFYNQVTPLRIGGDYRSGNSWYLHDEKIKSIAMYKGVPTDSAVTTDGLVAMFSYDLESESASKGYLNDLSSNNNNAINPNVYVDPQKDNGFVFENANTYFDMEEAITPNGSMTFEAFMTLPENDNANRLGWVAGNYIDFQKKEFGIEFQANRKIRVFICKGSKANKSIQFTLPEEDSPGTYRRLTFVLNVNGDISLYVDGTQVGTTQNILSWMGSSPETFYNQVTPLRIGGDYRGGNTYYLKNLKVKSVAMYKGVPTDSAVTTDGLEAMFSYNLTADSADNGYLKDLSLNDNNAKNGSKYVDTRDYDYSFAIVGDTQYMTNWDTVKLNGVQSNTQHLKKVYDWILSNRKSKKIAYVMGLGDITDSYNKNYSKVYSTGNAFDTAAEWKHAYSQISRLDGLVPYSVVRGNHDNEAYFDKYFADSVSDDEITNSFYKSQFFDPDYSDNSVCFYDKNSALNAYNKFEVGTEKYLLLLLDDNANDDVLAWAGNVIDRNPDYRVIINTHTYLGYTGDHIDDSEIYSYATGNVAAGENNGKQIWEKLVSKHENIVLVLCGHDYKAYNILKTERIGENGNAVTEMLICPQSRDGNDNRDPKAGMVAMLYFSNGGKDVRVEYISTALSLATGDGSDVYAAAETNNISFSLMNDSVPSEYGFIPYSYSNIDEYPFVIFDGEGNCIGAAKYLYGTTSATSAMNIAKVHVSTNVYDAATDSYGTSQKNAIILMRKDYDLSVKIMDPDGEYADLVSEWYDNLAQIKGMVTIDLNGFKLSGRAGDAIFRATMKAWGGEVFPSKLVVKNGDISVSDNALVVFKSSAAGKKMTFGFENVDFFVTGTTANFAAKYSAGTVDGLKAEMYFDDCDIDLSAAAANEIVLFNLGDASVSTTVKVNSGSITLGEKSLVMYSKTSGTGNLVFGKVSGGAYTAISISNEKDLPTTAVNDGALTFVKISETADSVTYRLRPTATTSINFVPKMSLTLDNNFIMNVYVPANNALQNIVFNGTTFSVADLEAGAKETIDGDVYYVLTVELPAAEAIKTVTLEATIAANGGNAKATFSFSIPKYATKVIANGNATETALVKDVLAYVKSAYAYFNANGLVTDEALAEATKIVDAILGDYTCTFAKVEGTTEHAEGITDVTLVFGAKPAIRFYGEASQNYTYKYNNIVLESVYNETDKYTDVYLYAYQMIGTVIYTDGTNSGSYHINTYYDGVDTSDTALIDLVEKLYNYCKSAESYRASVLAN